MWQICQIWQRNLGKPRVEISYGSCRSLFIQEIQTDFANRSILLLLYVTVKLFMWSSKPSSKWENYGHKLLIAQKVIDICRESWVKNMVYVYSNLRTLLCGVFRCSTVTFVFFSEFLFHMFLGDGGRGGGYSGLFKPLLLIFCNSLPIKAVTILHCGQWAEVTALTLAWHVMNDFKTRVVSHISYLVQAHILKWSAGRVYMDLPINIYK